MVSKNLLNILACPNCKAKVKLNEKKTQLLCKTCNLAYKIKNGIPIMIVEKAEKLL